MSSMPRGESAGGETRPLPNDDSDNRFMLLLVGLVQKNGYRPVNIPVPLPVLPMRPLAPPLPLPPPLLPMMPVVPPLPGVSAKMSQSKLPAYRLEPRFPPPLLLRAFQLPILERLSRPSLLFRGKPRPLPPLLLCLRPVISSCVGDSG